MLPTAMIVEDNKEMRDVIRLLVEDIATIVDECDDGSEVLHHYRSSHPDVVFMDIAMKKIDGITATKMLRTEFPYAKVVMVSNYEDAEMKSEAAAAGSVAYVQKDNLIDLRFYFNEWTDGIGKKFAEKQTTVNVNLPTADRIFVAKLTSKV